MPGGNRKGRRKRAVKVSEQARKAIKGLKEGEKSGKASGFRGPAEYWGNSLQIRIKLSRK